MATAEAGYRPAAARSKWWVPLGMTWVLAMGEMRARCSRGTGWPPLPSRAATISAMRTVFRTSTAFESRASAPRHG